MPKVNKTRSHSRAKKITAAAHKIRIQKNVFSIIRMPEDQDEAPHWMYWLLVIVFILLIISIFWREFSDTPSIQAYLPNF
ncbi:hypothetical protein DRH29_01020 [candidate division Kazan bacterium]|uniref:Uncharacterized protein n=1 Tax=candidate division Kazan bacterium TaxID=2202143 RepID=A0A420ZDH9_UNCK3|nr:MAG: hypothetical protein DRH29_01020 [candidate division Kazan bacterium]